MYIASRFTSFFFNFQEKLFFKIIVYKFLNTQGSNTKAKTFTEKNSVSNNILGYTPKNMVITIKGRYIYNSRWVKSTYSTLHKRTTPKATRLNNHKE